jgi:NAD(P)-dependent dehydrogenase (short-subunit alcohol dehydrogenase family)
MELQGTSAIISGGASGLGAATARELAGAGCTVVLADLNEDAGKALAAEIGGVFVTTDVTSGESVQAAVLAAHDTGAPLRVAVACAGIASAARTLNRDGTAHDEKLYRKVIEVNLIGTFNLLRLAAAQMSRTEPLTDNERGVIVCTASVAAFDGQIGQLAYTSSKGAVAAMVLPAARDLAAVGIRVNAIAPGTFETPMLAGLSEAARTSLAKDVVFPGRLGRPEEYASLVRSIVEQPYLNGEVIRLDGGIRMPPK